MRVMTDLSNPRQEAVVQDIIDERVRQDAMFGEQNHHPAYWLALIGKQTGQLGQAVVQREWASTAEVEVASLGVIRYEAVQLAAVAFAMIEAIDRGDVPMGLITAKPGDPRQLATSLGRGHENIDYDDEDKS